MSKKIAVLSASWHTPIVESAERAFVEVMEAAGHKVTVIKVPGSLEIPLSGKLAFDRGFHLAVGIGFVTDGKIYHREFVAQSVVQSILDVSLASEKPFLSVVLAPQNFEEGNAEHEKWFADHMAIKGQEAAQAALRMLAVPGEIKAAS